MDACMHALCDWCVYECLWQCVHCVYMSILWPVSVWMLMGLCGWCVYECFSNVYMNAHVHCVDMNACVHYVPVTYECLYVLVQVIYQKQGPWASVSRSKWLIWWVDETCCGFLIVCVYIMGLVYECTCLLCDWCVYGCLYVYKWPCVLCGWCVYEFLCNVCIWMPECIVWLECVFKYFCVMYGWCVWCTVSSVWIWIYVLCVWCI